MTIALICLACWALLVVFLLRLNHGVHRNARSGPGEERGKRGSRYDLAA